MGDLPYLQREGEIQIVGQDSSGNQVNYVTADANGNMAVKDYADGPVTPGTAASVSSLIGGQFNTALPALTNTQQSAIQLDSSGRIIVRNSEFPATVDTNYGTVGASTLRTAAQIGNATGAADFNAGATGAQTLRVTANTYDGSGNAITSTASESKQALDVIINAPTKATYSSATGLFSPGATPTDMWVIQGSATKVVKILKIRLDFTQTTAGNNSFYLKRYSTADTDGTSVAESSFPFDVANAAATATVKSYTANPTLGTLTGSLDVTFIGVPTNGAPSSAVGTTSYFWDFTNNQGSPIVLDGVADQIAINFNGAAKPGGLQIAVFVMFTEE